MEKEEILLGVEMERLEIEPVKSSNRNSENPFINLLLKRKFSKNLIPPKLEIKCTCNTRKIKHNAIYKKKHSKILKEPILKILKTYRNSSIKLEPEEFQESASRNISDNLKSDTLNLCTLVQNCNQLTISPKPSEQNIVTEVSNEHKWWKNDILPLQGAREPKAHSNQSGTCSQQALNPPCDVTIDELASYFETLVHIPKKMSSMAEMMYI